MALPFFVESAPRAYWLKAGNADPPISTSGGTSPGRRVVVTLREAEFLRQQGWRLRMSKDDFLEAVHLQAWYFQVRFFPRLAWLMLGAPPGRSFIIGDRPVVWGFAGGTDLPPSVLRHANVQLIAPLSRGICLFGYNPLKIHPDVVTTSDVNQAIAAAAHHWIAGSTEASVKEALQMRTYH
ncbi:MAG TPA: DUF4238 domain-containing protein [Caulobacteraceae bacterium]|nr:DUF4238 domain-containing protein [Caulobacteraceae bacterium]